MWHEPCPGDQLFAVLAAADEALAAEVARAGCRHCGGALHRGDYARKPRGLFSPGAEPWFSKRFSLCCGRRGCRRRSLPPSLRFLGRRVYVEAAVLLACTWALVRGSAAGVRARFGVPARTVGRWLAWWSVPARQHRAWLEARARFRPPPPDEQCLPLSLLERLTVDLEDRVVVDDVLLRAARLLAPMTTPLPDSTRFLWVV